MSCSCSFTEHREEVEQLRNKLKEEKQNRKKQQVKIDSIEEELSEVKQEKESTEKVCSYNVNVLRHFQVLKAIIILGVTVGQSQLKIISLKRKFHKNGSQPSKMLIL